MSNTIKRIEYVLIVLTLLLPAVWCLAAEPDRGAPSAAVAGPPERQELDKLDAYMTSFRLLKATLFRGISTRNVPDDSGNLVTIARDGWFEDDPLRKEKEIIEFVSTMKSAPAIPDAAVRHFFRAGTLIRSARTAPDYRYAIDSYKEALFEAPWWGDAYYNLGIAFTLAGRDNDAVESFKLYLLTKPGETDRIQVQTKIHEIEAKKEMAGKRYDSYKQEAALGSSDYSRGPSGYDDAILHWKRALELNPDDPDNYNIYYSLGEIYMNRGDLDEAGRNMQKSFELKPEQSDAIRYSNFGSVLQRSGDHNGACRYFKKGCEADEEMSCISHRSMSCW